MPSPFPGMDPFLEGQRWPGFPHHLLEEILSVLVPRIGPRYVADVEERVFIEHHPEEPRRLMRPDVYAAGTGTPGPAPGGGLATAVVPVELTLPMPVEERDPFLTIRDREGLQLVAVIEVLSPSNKRAGTNDREDYLAKR